MVRVGFDRQLLRLALLLALTAAVTACGSKANSSPGASSASTQASPTSTATPTPVPAGRNATASELAAMISAGKDPAEKELGLGDGANCPAGKDCLWVDQATGTIGVNAGLFHAREGCASGCFGGSGCWVFLYQAAGAWHYVNAHCAQATGEIPGPDSIVYVSGCANVRDNPGSSGKVVTCLSNGTQVNVDSAPLYTDGKIWWHLAGKGWMAHDFLVAPKVAPSPS